MSDAHHHFEPSVGNAGAILASVIGAVTFAWSVFIFPEVDRYGQNIAATIRDHLRAQTVSYQEVKERPHYRIAQLPDRERNLR